MPGLGDRIRTAGRQISAAGPEVIPGWMMVAGIGSWMIAGIAVVFWLAGWFFVTTASISIPLVLAVVVGMIAYPLCEKMIARKIPKAAAALIVLLGLVAVVVAVVWLVVAGVLSQLPTSRQASTQASRLSRPRSQRREST